MDYENGSFDVIISNEAILYSIDKAKTMAKTAQLVAPGGRVVLGDIV